MTDYRRLRVPGGTYFFTVNLADRCTNLLTREIHVLREAVRKVNARHPFHIDAWVILPEHVHPTPYTHAPNRPRPKQASPPLHRRLPHRRQRQKHPHRPAHKCAKPLCHIKRHRRRILRIHNQRERRGIPTQNP